MKDNKWLRLLTYVTGLVNQELLLQNEYLAAKNRILRAHLPARLRLSDPERSTLAEIGKRLGRRALAQVACVAKPDTILAWYRRLIASKFDGSKHRSYPGRPRIGHEIEGLIVRMARENSGWGYDRIVGALANLGHRVSDQTVGNILRRHGMEPSPKRSQNTTWRECIESHMAVLAGIDFFTVEVLTWRGLVTYYVLFFIHLESRRVSLAGITRHPDEAWMLQMARNATDESWGHLERRRYALHDRDTKFCASFRATLASGGIKPIQLPARSPNLNAFAERWVRSVKQECLSKLILFGEASLRRALGEFVEHFHVERNHQGKGNVLLFPSNDANHSQRRRSSAAENALADRSSTTGVPHEYFGLTEAANRKLKPLKTPKLSSTEFSGGQVLGISVSSSAPNHISSRVSLAVEGLRQGIDPERFPNHLLHGHTRRCKAPSRRGEIDTALRRAGHGAPTVHATKVAKQHSPCRLPVRRSPPDGRDSNRESAPAADRAALQSWRWNARQGRQGREFLQADCGEMFRQNTPRRWFRNSIPGIGRQDHRSDEWADGLSQGRTKVHS